MKNEIKEVLLKRFSEYVTTYSESSGERADAGEFPSTPQQWNMSKVLVKELKKIDLSSVKTTRDCYTYGYLPASEGFEKNEAFCLLAHIDTADEVSGENVIPVIHENYDGRIIELKENTVLDPESDACLREAAENRETIITSDGTTLLGADDKAGIAEIITAIEYVKNHPEIKHGPVEVIFSPDEETGHGMDKVPLHILKSKYAYTVDGGHIGELETECFNAWKTEVEFTGKACHTGTARNFMVNANMLAASFISNIPVNQRPETSMGHEGFIAVMDSTSSMESARITLLLRDFTLEGIEEKKNTIQKIADMVTSTFGGSAKATHTQQYLNMKEKLSQKPEVIERLKKAYELSGVRIINSPIRGGTDGSRLTEMGIPTPNIFTGGHNFHSRSEWASLDQMCKAVEVLVNLIEEKQGPEED